MACFVMAASSLIVTLVRDILAVCRVMLEPWRIVENSVSTVVLDEGTMMPSRCMCIDGLLEVFVVFLCLARLGKSVKCGVFYCKVAVGCEVHVLWIPEIFGTTSMCANSQLYI